jgi:hypothetical protein
MASHAHADMTGGAISGRSLIEGGDVQRWAVGIHADVQERILESPAGVEAKMETTEPGVFASCDLSRWLQIFATIGQSKMRIDGGEYSDYEMAWSAGGRLSFWETSIPKSSAFYGTLRLFGSYQFSDKGSGSISGFDYDWQENSASLALRLEKYHQTMHSYPWAAYVGPTWSDVDIELENTGAVSEAESTGIVAGIDVFFPNNIFFGYEVRVYEESSHGFQLGVHF